MGKVNSIATWEGIAAIAKKFGLKEEDVAASFTEAYQKVVEQAADGDGICLRIVCDQQVDPASGVLCEEHLKEI